jgi:hypothetical protein
MSISHYVLDGELVIQDPNINTITWKGKPKGYTVVSVTETPEKVDCIVLLEYWANGNRFKNLLRIDPNGSIIWEAELPSGTGVDAYVKAEWRSAQLTAWSWSGFMVTIDHEKGSILNKKFVK